MGAGSAGLAAAVRLAEQGYRVSLVEKRGRLGGRISSFDVPGVAGMADSGQHLLLRRAARVCRHDRHRRSAALGRTAFRDPSTPSTIIWLSRSDRRALSCAAVSRFSTMFVRLFHPKWAIRSMER
ncbi:FAD-dependent oxidoreductase [Nocardia sp. NPDC047654]|uniref:FAD-dependent oxidoreductase n=1 Tax=Nocardia sp. NPDC047654 TaxID=3364314 RepID=UPI00371B44E2